MFPFSFVGALVILKYLNTDFKVELELPEWAKLPRPNSMIKEVDAIPARSIGLFFFLSFVLFFQALYCY
jgi:hypothetical protein